MAAVGRVWHGCCTFMLHVACSSRSRVLSGAASAMVRLTGDWLSVSVGRRPLLWWRLVTDLVTPAARQRCRAIAGQGG